MTFSAINRINFNLFDKSKIESQGNVKNVSSLFEEKTKRTTEAARNALQFFEKRIWPFFSEMRSFIKQTLKIAVILSPEFGQRLNPIINRLGLVSLVSVLFTLKNMSSKIDAVLNHMRLHDREGLIFAGMDVSIAHLDALDNFTSVWDALESFDLVSPIEAFSLISLPLSFTLLSYGALVNAYKAIWNGIELYRLSHHIQSKDGEELYLYLKERIGVTAQEKEKITGDFEKRWMQDHSSEEKAEALKQCIKNYKTRKRNILARHTDAKVVHLMRHFKQNLKQHTIQSGSDKKASVLKDIKKVIFITGTLNTATAVANTAMVALLILPSFVITPLPAIVSPVVSLSRSAFTLVKISINQFVTDHVVENSDWMK